MPPFRTPKRKIWLITWDYTREDYFADLGRRHIAGILDSRLPTDFVERYLPLLYSTERELLNFEKFSEMYLQSCQRHENPDWKAVRNEVDVLTFGNHPWLTARRVEGFFVDVIDYETENTYWIEPERLVSTPERTVEKVTDRRLTKLMSRRRADAWCETFQFGDDAAPPARVSDEA
jgi:hypothetical protein